MTHTATLFEGMLPLLERVARSELVPCVDTVTLAFPWELVTTGFAPPDTVAPAAGRCAPESSNWSTLTSNGMPGSCSAIECLRNASAHCSRKS